MNEDILQSTNFDLNHLSLGFENALPDHDYFNYTWDNLPPLLGPFDNFFQTESAGESASNSEIKYPASLTQLNQHTEQTNSPQPDFFHLMEIVGHSKELEHLLNTDKELEHLLTERIDANIENNNEIWSSILPEKTLLCNEYCENFLKESAEQLQLQSHLPPLEVLGVNLNLYSYETDAVENNCTGSGNVDSNADDDNTTPAGDALFYASYNGDLDNIQNNNTVRYVQQNDARQINESTDNKIYVLNVDFEKYPSENDNFHILGNERTMRNKRRRSLLHDKVIEANEICRHPVQQAVRIDPINKEDKSFSCTIEGCYKVYAKASHLKAHLRRHSGVKPFPCTWPDCKWRFSRSDELARHRRSHSGIKPYKCEMCDKCFSRSDHLAKHRKVHRRRLAQYGCAFTQSQCKKFAAKYKNEHYKTRL